MSQIKPAFLTLVLALALPLPLEGRLQSATTDGVEKALRALSEDGARALVDGAGLTGSGRRLWAIEPLDPADSRPKLVLLGGLDGSPASAALVLDILRWWFTDPASTALRGQWQLAALPCARPDFCGDPPSAAAERALAFPPAGGFFDGKQDPTPHYIWRWTTMQAPTLVMDVRAAVTTAWQANGPAGSLVPGANAADPGSLVAALSSAVSGAAWSAPAPALRLDTAADGAIAAFPRVLSRAADVPSLLRSTLTARASRSPLDVARLLAPKYPAQPTMSYIPALSWSGGLRLAALTGERRYREKPIAEMTPFVSGSTPAIAEPYLLTSLAGHLALSDWSAIDGNSAAAAVARKAADFMLPEEAEARTREPQETAEIVRFPRQWTDDMFMATSVLARVAARTPGDERYAAIAGRLLDAYADQLQRPDGIFIHAKEGPHPWGRGNGFAAFGLMEALTFLPESWPHRAGVLQRYRALMEGLIAAQAPDGMWRQVVDEPGSYREFTVTAMVVTAMARGVRLGWLDNSYRPMVERAWHGLRTRIDEDGGLVDVCTGTGSGPTRQYYLDRAGITGADDRGGAMGLVAALEMEELARADRP